MVDTRIARWVNENYERFNVQDGNILDVFPRTGTTLNMGDFNAYFSWIKWCKKIANTLNTQYQNHNGGYVWRARDVEMAVFRAADIQNPLDLNVI